MQYQKILVIQTAFIGDVILATGILEKLHQFFPDVQLDFLVRKGNESLFNEHPFLNKLLIWDKRTDKYLNLWRITKQIRQQKYDLVINLQRFASTGFITTFSNGKRTIGFDKNPWSVFFTKKIRHSFKEGTHEIARNHALISEITDDIPGKPCLYPTKNDYQQINQYQLQKYICIAPTSVWFTKQFSQNQWVNLINHLPQNHLIYLLGAPTDADACQKIQEITTHPTVINLAGKLNLLQSAALIEGAVMNYVNDSAPMHLASAMNAPTCAVYCSTVPTFGFYPLADKAIIVEVEEKLDCRPCGIHGHKSCPQKHFKCSENIHLEQLTNILK